MSDVRAVLLLTDGEVIETNVEACEHGCCAPNLVILDSEGKTITLALDQRSVIYRQMPEDFMGDDAPTLHEAVTA